MQNQTLNTLFALLNAFQPAALTSKSKLYRLHAPEVEHVAKGKVYTLVHKYFACIFALPKFNLQQYLYQCA